MTAVTLNQATLDLEVNIQLRIPTLIIGPVGVGKTDIVRQIAAKYGALVIDKRASQMEPTDLAIPMPDAATRSVVMCLQEWLPNTTRDGTGLIILLFDELTDASLGVQAALNQLVLEGELPGYKLPSNVVIVATGNRAADKAASQKVSRATSNRLAVIEVGVDVQSWLNWAMASNVTPELVAYIQNAERMQKGAEALHRYPASGSDAVAFVTPRSLARCSKFFDPALGISDSQLKRLIAYNCGDDTAADIMTFLATWRLVPDLNAIIADPMNATLHREPSVNYVLTVALVSRLNHGNLPAIATYIRRMERLYQAAFWSNATAKDKTFEQTSEFVAFAIAQQKAA